MGLSLYTHASWRTTALPHETVCRHNYTEACIAANTILVRGLEIVRSTFGRTSPEYKQFIARSSAKEEEEETEEVVEVV